LTIYKNTKPKFSKFNAGSNNFVFLKEQMNMAKIKIAVAMGGYSSEYDISIKSGEVVCASLDPQRYEIYPIYVAKDSWNYGDPQGQMHEVNLGDFSFSNGQETIRPDVIFNTIHGAPGENGYLAALCDLIDLPQTSTHFYAAALTFNKRDCLSVLKSFGIKCAPSLYFNEGDKISFDHIKNTLGLPFFVKPNRSGSSYGISRVASEKEFSAALQKAFLEDSEILMERALVGTEVSVGTYLYNDQIQVLSPTEIVSENHFFDFEAKYHGKSSEITPARITEEETASVQFEAKRIFEALKMTGVCRTDFILEEGQPYFIETNSNPGLSKESLVPKQVRYAGMTLSDFFDQLIAEALKRHNPPES